jgi:hypothetical protein
MHKLTILTQIAVFLCLVTIKINGQMTPNFSTGVNTGTNYTPKLVTTDPSGNVYVAGIQTSGSNKYPKIYKFNSSGTSQWNHTYSSYDITDLKAFGVFSNGDSLALICSNEDVVLRINSSGNEGISFTPDLYIVNDAVIENDGEVYIAGTHKPGAYSQAALYKYSSGGNLLWSVLKGSVYGNSDELVINDAGTEILWSGEWSLDGSDILLFLRKLSTEDGSIILDESFNNGGLYGIPANKAISFDNTGNAIWARFEGRSATSAPADSYYSLWSYDTDENGTSETFRATDVWSLAAIQTAKAANNMDIFLGVSGGDGEYASIEKLNDWSLDLYQDGGVNQIITSSNYVAYYGWNGAGNYYFGANDPASGDLIDTISLSGSMITNIAFDNNENLIFATRNTGGIMGVNSYELSYCPNPFTQVTEDQTLCVSGTIDLEATTATSVTFTWYEGASQIHTNTGTTSSKSVTPVTNTTYKVEADNGTCVYSHDIHIVIDASPTIELTVENDGGCGNPQLVATPGFDYYEWVYEGFLNVAGGSSNQYLITDPDLEGSWSVNVQTVTGCDFTSNDVLVEMLREDGKDYYWVEGSGNWSDVSHWATTSGGNTKFSCVPNQYNNVIFDANSFSTNGQEVLLDIEAACNGMDWSAIDQNVSLNFDQSQTMNVYADLTLSSRLTSNVNFYLLADYVGVDITSNGADLSSSRITLNGQPTASFILQDSLYVNKLYINTGDFNSNGKKIVAENNIVFGADLTSYDISISNSWIETKGITFSALSSFSVTGSHITVSGGSFEPAGLTFDKVTLDGWVNVTNAATIALRDITDSSVVTLQSLKTLELDSLIIQGQSDRMITLKSSNSGIQSTINMSSTAYVAGEYLNIRDNNAAGGGTYKAVASVDNGNNTGWDFSNYDQIITFNTLSSKTYGDADFDLTAVASSGLPVSFESSDENVATIIGNTVTIVGAGTTTITASQTGNELYEPADDVDRTLNVYKATQTITFDSLPAKIDTDPPFTLYGTASSGLPVSYKSSNTGVATVSGDLVTIVSEGSTTITASQDGNDNYYAATPVNQVLVVKTETSVNSYDNSGLIVELFPNPSKDEIFISYPEEVVFTRMIISDIRSKVILDSPFQSKIDISGYKPGIYLLELYTNNNNIVLQFIKE